MIKSSSSSVANYEEAQSASSRAGFKYKIDISMRDSNYWLRIIEAVDQIDNELRFFINESTELKKILGSINSKVSKNHKWFHQF